jgi:hypothetical protein
VVPCPTVTVKDDGNGTVTPSVTLSPVVAIAEVGLSVIVTDVVPGATGVTVIVSLLIATEAIDEFGGVATE